MYKYLFVHTFSCIQIHLWVVYLNSVLHGSCGTCTFHCFNWHCQSRSADRTLGNSSETRFAANTSNACFNMIYYFHVDPCMVYLPHIWLISMANVGKCRQIYHRWIHSIGYYWVVQNRNLWSNQGLVILVPCFVSTSKSNITTYPHHLSKVCLPRCTINNNTLHV